MSLKTSLRENRRSRGTLARVGKYTLVRATVLLITVIFAVYAMILVANLGGYVDEVVRANIDRAVAESLRGSDETPEERVETWERMKEAAYDAAGLNEPFVLRSFRWLRQGLTLDWGDTTTASVLWSSRRRPVREAVLENLPRTLLIFGTANLLLFVTTVALALPLTRKQGGWVDRLVIGLSPLSVAPAWVYGLILNVVTLRVLGSVFAGGAFDQWPQEFHLSHFPILLRHLALPAAAIFLSGLFQGMYAWRTLFSLHSREDYVEMAVAKGVPNRRLDRNYILRPLLPSVLTSFAFLFVSLWQDVIVLEHVFHVAGIGRLLMNAIRRYDTPVIVALAVTFAYLLAITVFVLDVLYALVDPRVRIGGERQAAKAFSKKRRWWPWRLLRRAGAQGEATKRQAPAERRWDGAGWRRDPLSGLEALGQILGGFSVAENVRTDRVGAGDGPLSLNVDRLYPELGLAIRFAGTGGDSDGAGRRGGIWVVEMDPNGPASEAFLAEVRAALSAAARRVAQRRGSTDVKRALMPRIAAAKTACDRILEMAEPDEPHAPAVGPSDGLPRRVAQGGAGVVATLRGLSRYPSATIGLFVILAMIGVSICTVVVLPYDEMIELWRGSTEMWMRNPRAVPPAWVNLFRRETLPTTIRMSSGDATLDGEADGGVGPVTQETAAISDDMTEILITFPFDFDYDEFPQDLGVFVSTSFDQKLPMVTFLWLTPDGREIELRSEMIERFYTYRVSQDERLLRRLRVDDQMEGMFAAPEVEPRTPLKGRYELQVKTYVFEEQADASADFVLYGQVHGLAGTDARRRDLLIPLLWGMPIALAFGFVAAVGTSLSAMVAAGIGAWFGGAADSLLQRVSEVTMLLPFLPVSLMVYTMYTKSVWAILGIAVLVISLGQTVKTYRAIFLQVKESPYVEAAQAYGASGWRIVFRYLVPRVVPAFVPQLVILVPSYVFLEATLTVLGVTDPVLPTWGKLVVSGLSRGINLGELHMLLQPLALLLLIAFSFILVGVGLERVFEPRLREE